jgi:hypothetical protein
VERTVLSTLLDQLPNITGLLLHKPEPMSPLFNGMAHKRLASLKIYDYDDDPGWMNWAEPVQTADGPVAVIPISDEALSALNEGRFPALKEIHIIAPTFVPEARVEVDGSRVGEFARHGIEWTIELVPPKSVWPGWPDER